MIHLPLAQHIFNMHRMDMTKLVIIFCIVYLLSGLIPSLVVHFGVKLANMRSHFLLTYVGAILLPVLPFGIVTLKPVKELNTPESIIWLVAIVASFYGAYLGTVVYSKLKKV